MVDHANDAPCKETAASFLHGSKCTADYEQDCLRNVYSLPCVLLAEDGADVGIAMFT